MQANKPDEVTIISQPEENEGCIYAKIPVSYLKITQKKKKNFTEEQLEAARQRMKELGKKRRKERE